MPITPSQLSSILRVKKEFSLITGAITLTDLTNWAGSNIIAPDTASVLLKLVSPTGAVVYQNIGYDTNNFGSPDFTLTTSVVSKTMPQDVNGNYITGTYTLYAKAQVVQGIDNVTTSSVIQQTASALPNNVMTQGAATPPPFSTIKLFVLGNVSTALMHEGDVYGLEVNGDTVSYTVPSSTQTVQQFYYQLYLTILSYQAANPLSDWNNVAGSFGSSGNQYWLNLNRTDGNTMSLNITYTPSGTPQISNVSFFTTPNGSDPLVGDILSITYSGETITYQVQNGDDLGAAITGLYNEIQAYIVANPASNWATTVTVTNGFNYIQIEYNTGNTPFVVTSNVTATTTPVITSSNEVSSTAEVCNCSVTISIDIDVDYATAVLTSTDTTSYGAYSSISRTHTIYPPPISGLPNQTTSATTNVYSNIVTTTWSVKITSNVTYLKANDTYTTCQLIGTKEVVVEADTLCATLCLLKKFRTDFYAKYGKKCVDDMEKAYNLAMDEFYLAFMATRCGRPQSEIQGYINKIYEITGLDPNCDCGCNAGDYPTPVVPTSIINGTDGTDGVTPEFQNTGTWIQVSYDNGLTWNNLFSLASVTGAAGANGTNGTDGADGVAVLENDLTGDTTTNAGVETLKTYQLSAGQLASDGDMIEIRARFTVANKNSGTTTGDCYVFLGATQLTTSSILNSIYGGYHVIRISRTGAATGKSDNKINTMLNLGGIYQESQPFANLTSVAPTWANAIDIYVKADDNGGEAITCDLFQVTYYKK